VKKEIFAVKTGSGVSASHSSPRYASYC